MSFSLVFSRRYCMAHRLLDGPSEACATPHGHNEIVSVTLVDRGHGVLDGKSNMVAPFETAKKSWHKWIDECVDHAFQLNARDPLIVFFRQHEPERLARILTMPGDPTTEALAACFMGKVNAFLEADGEALRCVEVRVEETPTNTVTFTGDPKAVLPGEGWWLRPDMSINDLGVAK